MGSKFITYTDHGVFESSSMLATKGGAHLINLVADKDIDNGNVCALGDFVAGDVWKAAIPKKTDPILFIGTSPKIYEEYTKKMQEESNFYNAAGEVMRGYQAPTLDKCALSKECFEPDATVEKGKYVCVTGTGYKLTTVATEPTDTAFVGFIYDVATNGNFRILVKKNG